LLVIVNDILDFSKMEAGMMAIERVAFSLQGLIADCLKPLAVRAFDKQLELLVRIAPDVPDALVGDPGRLRQILTNLVGNAIKFTEQGEVCVEVSLNGAVQGLNLTLDIQVRDTGIGIALEQQAEVFDAFSQADATVTRRFGGTGLGLAIARGLAHLMGGQIAMTSEVGQGSRFVLTVPMTLQTVRPSAPPSLGQALTGLRVLVADDNATQRDWIAQLLGTWGVDVALADSGHRALGLLNSTAQPFDAVVMDARMPDLSGFAVLQSLPASEALLRRTLMLLPANEWHSGVARCSELGVNAYLVKPVSPFGPAGCAAEGPGCGQRWRTWPFQRCLPDAFSCSCSCTGHPSRRGQPGQPEAGHARPGTDGAPDQSGDRRCRGRAHDRRALV
jgi:two-component system sensor histidine kinase/response regulator